MLQVLKLNFSINYAKISLYEFGIFGRQNYKIFSQVYSIYYWRTFQITSIWIPLHKLIRLLLIWLCWILLNMFEVTEVLFPCPNFNLVYAHHFTLHVFVLRLMFIMPNLKKVMKVWYYIYYFLHVMEKEYKIHNVVFYCPNRINYKRQKNK